MLLLCRSIGEEEDHGRRLARRQRPCACRREVFIHNILVRIQMIFSHGLPTRTPAVFLPPTLTIRVNVFKTFNTWHKYSRRDGQTSLLGGCFKVKPKSEIGRIGLIGTSGAASHAGSVPATYPRDEIIPTWDLP